MLSAETDDSGDSGCYRNVRVSFTRNTVSYSLHWLHALFHGFYTLFCLSVFVIFFIIL